MNTNGKMAKPIKKTKGFIGKLTDAISWFLGSWWAVVVHTLWFSIWLGFNFDINLLTFSVSLEAIFIGIFLLMASNKAEAARIKKEVILRKNDRARIEMDIKLDESADRQLVQIKRNQRNMDVQIKELMKEIKTLKK